MSRVENEKKFHNTRFSDGKVGPSKYYKALEIWNRKYSDFIAICSHKKILEIGSGLESICNDFGADETFNISSIDISDEAISLMNDLIYKNCKFFVMDAHKTTFNDSSFDLICGKGVLHHLDLKVAIEEIRRLLKPDGVVIFAEPLNTNFIINIYRALTPNIRTIDERPLSNDDINFIKINISHIEVKYYGFLTLILSILNKKSPKLIHAIDDFILNSTPVGRYLAWSCLIYSKKKQK